jgi:hypothetical protein
MTINSNDEFAKKGIPERVIEEMSNYLQRSIKSSPVEGQPGDFLVGASKKAWERFVAQNSSAYFDNYSGCFMLSYQ